MKIVKINSCFECPYSRAFIVGQCAVMKDDDEHDIKDFYFKRTGIHPKCLLDDYEANTQIKKES